MPSAIYCLLNACFYYFYSVYKLTFFLALFLYLTLSPLLRQIDIHDIIMSEFLEKIRKYIPRYL